ncbi:hypothetical protein N8I77_007457 [Diaporthe amygdali]|uniref:Uncharacterized protein n=1 Tax=Phomopsis amygdali TaxID=1214568 RepID=A0AAD9W1K7_PHOAM|nr:hypothetical protein N8I77_007457 [Diaporthe amygdali]
MPRLAGLETRRRASLRETPYRMRYLWKSMDACSTHIAKANICCLTMGMNKIVSRLSLSTPDLQHHMWRLLLRGRLSIAPIGEPASVLDIGTGTGIWAIQFAKQHPGADVVGTDLSLIQPTDNVPPNCRFEREDSEEDWVHDVPFDYIHWRLMCTCFSDIKGMMAKVYGNLKPGGWAEFHDVAWELVGADDEASAVLDGSALAKFFRYAVAGGTAFGRDFEAGRKYKEWMVEAGFEGVVERQVLAPVNAWPLDPVDRTIGNWFCVDVHRVLDGTTKLLEAGGLPLAEVPSFLDDVRESITSREMRVYCPHYIVYGRRPAGPSQAASTASAA